MLCWNFQTYIAAARNRLKTGFIVLCKAFSEQAGTILKCMFCRQPCNNFFLANVGMEEKLENERKRILFKFLNVPIFRNLYVQFHLMVSGIIAEAWSCKAHFLHTSYGYYVLAHTHQEIARIARAGFASP